MSTVLVINSGSSSIKFQLTDPGTGEIRANGIVEKIGESESAARISAGSEEHTFAGEVGNHEAGMAVVDRLFADAGITLDASTVDAVGHRIVQGGSIFPEPTLIDDAVRDQVHELGVLAPLHNYAAVDGIDAARKLLADLPHVAVFDTSFFHALPPSSRNYAINRELAEKHSIYRYGAHGTSHRYVSEQVPGVLGRAPEDTNTIVLHLGNGASASAVQGGRPIDTSMGLTPLEGLVMGTRTGDIDPTVYYHLHRVADMSAPEIDTVLNKHSGMLGMCGFNDFRDITARMDDGDEAAQLAFGVYIHRLRKYIGSYAFLLGRVDAIAFTAGIGENLPQVRAAALEGLEGFGITIDADRNAERARGTRVISSDDSATTVLVLPTNEELAIAQQTLEVAGR